MKIFLVILLTFLAYSNVFSNPFVFDDRRLVIDWPVHHSFSNIPQLFSKDSDINALTWNYRPVRGILFMISYQLFGQNPFGYHLVTILMHLANTVLVYLIVEQLMRKVTKGTKESKESNVLKTSDSSDSSATFDSLRYLPFATALLFGLHPIHTEGVTFITAGYDSIGFLFFLSSVFLYIKASKVQKAGWQYFMAIFFALLCVFSYEITIILPFILLVWEFVFRKISWRVAPFFLVSFVYLFCRFVFGGLVGRGGYLADSFYLTMLTMTKAILVYLKLLILPMKLSLNQYFSGGIKAHFDEMKSLDPIRNQSILDPVIIFSIVVIVVSVGLAIRLRKTRPIISFGILWFFTSLLPFMFLVPQGTIMQERYIYAASLGFILVLADLALFLTGGKFFSKKSARGPLVVFVTILFAALAIFYGVRTYIRNLDWRSEQANWAKMANDFPHEVQANFVTASYLFEKGDLDGSVFYFNRVLETDNELSEGYFRLGRVYEAKGDRVGAILNFQKVLELGRNTTDAEIELSKLGASDSWKKYEARNLSFYYPSAWKISAANSINLSEGDFSINIAFGDLKPGQNPQDFFLGEKSQHGKLVGQGTAQIPGFDAAFARTFDEAGVGKLQLFLYRDPRVLKILVYPSASSEMKIFEKILGTIEIS